MMLVGVVSHSGIARPKHVSEIDAAVAAQHHPFCSLEDTWDLANPFAMCVSVRFDVAPRTSAVAAI